ncbi:MAG: CatB-related O-acetyltransferase [Sterolibacterium sp.]
MLDVIVNHPSQSVEKVYFSGNTPVLSIGCHSYTGNIRLCVYDYDQRVTIGKFCSLANDIEFTLVADHSLDTLSTFPFEVIFPDEVDRIHQLTRDVNSSRRDKKNVLIENDVWIGRGAKILTGVTIGNGAVVGAECVVSKDVPPYAVVVGNPMRIIRYRFRPSEIILLQDICWWNWPLNVIKQNYEIFYTRNLDKITSLGDQLSLSSKKLI